jgi:hypothetical protein
MKTPSDIQKRAEELSKVLTDEMEKAPMSVADGLLLTAATAIMTVLSIAEGAPDIDTKKVCIKAFKDSINGGLDAAVKFYDSRNDNSRN